MEKVKKFDEELRSTYQDIFFFGKFLTYMFLGLGILLMMIPFEPSDGFHIFMVQGILMAAMGVRQYLHGYLFVKEEGKLVSIYEKLAFMPVTKEEIQKVRCGYLNHICVRAGSTMFVVQQAASLLNHSFGVGSVLFAVCGAVIMWGSGWMLIYMSK